MDTKPIDITEAHPDLRAPEQSEEKKRLAQHVQSLFRAAYNANSSLDLYTIWRKCDDYKNNQQNPKQSEDHPGSQTNIIHPIIESQIADLVDKPFGTTAKGWEPGDDQVQDEVQHLMDFVLYRNRFKTKLNISEHDRLELGETVIKVWFDHEELDGKGLPTFDPILPSNFYFDPKVKHAHLLQKGDFAIHALPQSLGYIQKKYKEWGKYVMRETSVPYNPQDTFESDGSENADEHTNNQAMVLEAYLKDENCNIFCVHVANNLVLEDSRELKTKKKVQRRNKYPFVMIPCYLRRGTAHGKGDVELLMPTQDLINEMDDMIRMNGRLTAFPQRLIGQQVGVGFDPRKWTSKPNLNIPVRDVNAVRILEPRPISPDIPMRREKAFEEANIISGRPDVNRGEAPGSITAASAIAALQEAGQKSTAHKGEMFKDGWGEVLELLFDEVLEHWDQDMWVRIDGEQSQYEMINPSMLRQVPHMITNPNPMMDEMGNPLEDTLKPLKAMTPVYSETGEPIPGMEQEGDTLTRDAMFDFQLSLGNGFPSDKTFRYQAMLEAAALNIAGKPGVTWREFREFVRTQVGLELHNDDDAEKELAPPMPMMPPGAPIPPPGAPIPPPGAPMPPPGGDVNAHDGDAN